jgi:hypothetical protein
MSAVCPACGVSVVPGYVRCPRCHRGLPRIRRTTGDPGGTAVVQRGFPWIPVVIAVGVAAAVILAFGLRRSSKPVAEAPAALPGPVDAIPAPVTPRAPRAPGAAPAVQPAAAATASEPDRRAAASEVEAVLRRQRLWGRADIAGDRIDVRSGSCGDAAMRPAIDGVASLLHSTGLTRLRCLEQSGAVVFERDL